MHNFKHLTEENRKDIEDFLDKGYSFSKIAIIINKDRTTIAKEIKRYRIKKIPKNHNNYIQRNFCIYKFNCGRPNCPASKPCYIEDICPKLLKPPYVCNSCPDNRFCRKIKYCYLYNSAHKSYLQTLKESRTGINITEDQLAIIDKHISPLLKENKQPINHIYTYNKTIGIENYKKYFEVVLTDNCSEFSSPTDVEVYNDTGELVANLFYCDANASWQKGNIEKNHEFIRYVLPKGSSFNDLTQDDVDLLMNHINNTCRNSLDKKSPYDLTLHMNFLEKLNLYKISPKDVNLSPNLLKK